MSICKFLTDYHDETDKSSNIIREFKCQNPSLDSGFCRFHDESYVHSHEAEIVELLLYEIDSKLSRNEPIFFIGYIIPNIKIKSVFSNTVYFSKSKFYGIADFSDSIFRQDVSFEGVFFRNAKFTHTKFDYAFFHSSIFEQVEFAGCVIDYPIFTDSKFAKFLFLKCKIRHAFFAGINCNRGSFAANKFGYVSFYKAIFNKNSFINSSFDDVEFSEAIFNDETDFQGTQFSVADFSKAIFKKKANFLRVIFSKPERVLFDGDLANVSFMDTDISKIQFSSRVKWGGKYGFAIIDDVEGRNFPEKANLQGILAIYRQLRENYEFNLRYLEAGCFFINEMELVREYKE